MTNFNSLFPFITYSVRENLALDTWDQNDTGKPFAGLTAFRNTPLKFFANFSAGSGSVPEHNETFCQIRFNTTLPWTSWIDMPYNSSSRFFEYLETFAPPSFVLWEMQCDSTLIGYFNLNQSDNITVPNRPPQLLANYPDITMFENTVAFGQDLDDYFSDPDGDALTFTALLVEDITINITSTNLVTYTPSTDFVGLRVSFFTANDTYGSSIVSNNYNITVQESPIPPPPPPPPPPSGGGGGLAPTPFCPTDFECTSFSDCKFKQPTVEDFLVGFTGYQTRSCTDINNCGLDHLKPEAIRGCHYRPTCFDLIRNQDEEGVDCGGPCPPCPTCDDNIRNQGEEGVDCGGPCAPCSECFDGIQNQGEEGVDCGGPCPPCKAEVIVPPEQVETQLNFWLLLIMILMVLLAVGVTTYFARPYLQQLLSWLQLKLEKITQVPAPQPTLFDVEKRTLARLVRLAGRVEIGDRKDLSLELVKVMREFYRTVSGLTFEFTYEELLGYLHNKKVGARTLTRLQKHTNTLNSITFGKDVLTRDKLRKEITEAKTLVSSVTRFLARTEVGAKELLKEKKERKRAFTAQKRMININKLLLKAEQAIVARRVDEAKALYNEARSSYLRLPLDQRKDVLKRIRQLYNRLSGGGKK